MKRKRDAPYQLPKAVSQPNRAIIIASIDRMIDLFGAVIKSIMTIEMVVAVLDADDRMPAPTNQV